MPIARKNHMGDTMARANGGKFARLRARLAESYVSLGKAADAA